MAGEYETELGFPISAYDRPSIAMANLLGGNLNGMTRAIFAPNTLTPSEIKTIRSKVLKGEAAKNPLLKTAVDIATNPIFIAGVVLSLGPWGKIASPAQFFKNTHAATQAIKPMMQEMKGIASPLTIFRNVPKLWDEIAGHTRAMGLFQSRMDQKVEKAINLFRATNVKRPLTKKDMQLVGMYMEGWHKPHNPIVSKYAQHFGTTKEAGKILAPGLEAKLKATPGLHKLASTFRKIDDEFGKKVFQPLDAAGSQSVREQLTSKGVHYIQENHFPRVVRTGGLERLATEGTLTTSARTLRAMARKNVAKGKIGFAARLRKGVALPLDDEVMANVDILDPKVVEGFRKIESSEMSTMTNSLRSLIGIIRQHGDPAVLQGVAKTRANAAIGNFERGIRQVLQKKLGGADIGEDMGKMIDEIVHQTKIVAFRPEREIDDFITGTARLFGAPARYSMNASEAMNAYSSAMAPTYSWITRGFGKRMDAIVKSGKLLKWQENEFTDNLAPMLKGRLHPREYVRVAAFKDRKLALGSWIANNPAAKKLLPKDTRAWVMNQLSDRRGSITESSLGGSITHLFHLSTLGANMGATSKNALQNLITTAPWLGMKNMALGAQQVSKRLPIYMKHLKSGIGKEKAFRRAFPEYHQMVGHENISEALRLGDVAKEGTRTMITAKGVSKTAQDALMAPFAFSEKVNRLWAFYSGQEAALASGLTRSQSAKMGYDVMFRTQFPGGVTGMPAGLRGVAAPLRQFMHFPLRYTEFVTSSTRFGPDPSKISTGVLGRIIAGSAGLATIAKNLFKTDISAGLAWGALPVPQYEGSPFFPFPLVPPAAGVAGNLLAAAVTGDTSKLGGTAALVVPGGLAGRRAYMALTPKHADYANRDATGRVPVYNKKGALIGKMTNMQLYMKAMGLKSSDVQGEQQAVGWLLSQREKIRDFRRKYIQALSSNDLEKARKINEQFARAYPELGQLSLKKSDIRAEKNRKQISRLNRVLKGMPKEFQPLFSELIAHSSISQIAEDAEFNPEMLQTFL